MARIRREADIAQAEAERDTAIKRAMALREVVHRPGRGRPGARHRPDGLRDAPGGGQPRPGGEAAEYDASARQRALAEKAYDIAANEAQQQVIAAEVKIEQVQRQEQIKVQELEVQRAAGARGHRDQAGGGRAAAHRDLAEANRQRVTREAAGQAEATGSRAAEAEIVRVPDWPKPRSSAPRGRPRPTRCTSRRAFREYNQAAVLDKLLRGMPEVARAFSEALRGVDKITVVSTGDGRTAAPAPSPARWPRWWPRCRSCSIP